jgi:hypothetical protein
MILTTRLALDPISRASLGEFNHEIPNHFVLGINSTYKFFCTTFEKFESH